MPNRRDKGRAREGGDDETEKEEEAPITLQIQKMIFIAGVHFSTVQRALITLLPQ